MKKKYILVSILLMLTIFIQAQLKIYTEALGNAQCIDEKGNLTGSSVEIVRAIQDRIGDTSEIELVPWVRGYLIVSSQADTMLFSTARSENREKLFKWVGPILTNQWILYAKKGSDLIINSLEDAKKVHAIGTYNSDVREQFLLEQGFGNIESVRDNIINVKKLMLDRVDLITGGRVEFMKYFVEEAGYSMSDLEQKYIIGESFLYLAFSIETDDEIIKSWERALKELNEEGIIQEIFNRWYVNEKAPEQVFFYTY